MEPTEESEVDRLKRHVALLLGLATAGATALRDCQAIFETILDRQVVTDEGDGSASWDDVELLQLARRLARIGATYAEEKADLVGDAAAAIDPAKATG